LEVDSKKLNRLLASRLQRIKENQNVLVVGHLAPYVLKPSNVDLVAILRRSPYELLDTFFARGYNAEKSKNNAASEILGIVSFDAIETFGKKKIAEFDTSRKEPEKTADEIVLTLQGRLAQRIGFVDWLALVEERNDLHKFFDLK